MPNLENYFLQIEGAKVIDSSISYSKYVALNLSTSNEKLSKIDLANAEIFENFIENHLLENNAKVAFGGYNEVRSLYNENNHFNAENRNIHLGIDFWIKAETPVLAALEGIVHSFNFNAGSGNYGPTIILEHTFENQKFYTLYGHLSTESIEDIEIGAIFKKGETLATLGDSSANGGYAPHLHFQIIKNIEDKLGDYPGVCSQKTLDFYLENCPDPNLLLKIT
ncbi:peptidoglycan DD-metalloendopeptidase family protein [Flavobacterium sp.]|uniref:peptidoglycan DD-metalloendopeptidase family protein n=1 Tax=Flavobacterium sp. TaxID=239 RepID=UPI0037B2791A